MKVVNYLTFIHHYQISFNYSPKSFSYRGHQWGLQSNLVCVNTINHSLRNTHGAIRVLDWSHVHRVPADRSLGSSEDLLNGCSYFWANPVPGYQCHRPGLAVNRLTDHLPSNPDINVTNLFVDKFLLNSFNEGDSLFNILTTNSSALKLSKISAIKFGAKVHRNRLYHH